MEFTEEQFQEFLATVGQAQAHSDLIKYQLDGAETVEKFELSLKGYKQKTYYERNKRGEPVPQVMWVKETKPIMNNDGINYLVRYLSQICNKDVILSDFHVDNIRNMTFEHGKQIYRDLVHHRDAFDLDLKNVKNLTLATTQVIFAALMRARDGNERRSIAEQRQVSEQIISQPNEERQGGNMFSRLVPGGRE